MSTASKMYYVELVWNREFNWTGCGDAFATKKAAKKFGKELLYGGDGARVKKFRVVDNDYEIVYPK